MSDIIERRDLEKSKGKPKAGSSTSANVLNDPDRYGSEKAKRRSREVLGYNYCMQTLTL
jgi:hypothetical protein